MEVWILNIKQYYMQFDAFGNSFALTVEVYDNHQEPQTDSFRQTLVDGVIMVLPNARVSVRANLAPIIHLL